MSASPAGIAVKIHIFLLVIGIFIQNNKCRINKILAGVHTNAIDLQDALKFLQIVFWHAHVTAIYTQDTTNTTFINVCTMASLRYNKYNFLEVCTSSSPKGL
jgi:hypothetical protein